MQPCPAMFLNLSKADVKESNVNYALASYGLDEERRSIDGL
jgi:hypothetical protein